MKTGPAFFIALRYLLGRAREGGRYLRGAALGIALSLVPIVVTLIVADGMIRGITDRYLELGTGHLQIYNYRDLREPWDPWDPASVLPFIEGLSGIRGAWSELNGLGILHGPAGSRGTAIRAIDASFLEDEGSRRFLVTISGEARLETDQDLLLGEELARAIGAVAGSTVRIMTIHSSSSGSFIPRVRAFNVRGIISSGYRELDSLWCIMSFQAGRQILPDAGAYLMLKIDDPYGGAPAMARSLGERLGSGYGINTWRTIQSSQYHSFESTRQLLLFIMALIVLVAAVNVSSATSMLVIERQRDIAVLKACGARPFFTSAVFLWGAFLTGLAGSVVGISAGLALGSSVNILIRGLERVLSFFSGIFQSGPVTILDSGYYLETIPIIIDGRAVLLIGFLTILSSVLASWIPARRAGKLKPIEILRKY
ncbi:MAG: ABC transporter permease [Treponema sp.]|nr:ABC transporter permease [Treponema sp.]